MGVISALTSFGPAPEDGDLTQVSGPPLPLGDRVWLRGRGTMFVRRVEGPPDARTVLLVHGWLASAGLNWFQCFDPLAEHFNVIAPDLRGHGRGIRSRHRFTLADCADDLAALIEREGCGPVIAVGYSMGGPVVQLLWRRHPHLVAGLGLCATGAEFVPGNRERYAFTALMSVAAGTTRVGQVAAYLPAQAARAIFGMRPPDRPGTFARWARSEMGRHNPRAILEAGHAIGNHSWDHPSLPRIGRSERLDQMRRCREVLEPYGAAIFRPPYGDQSLLSRIDAYRLGYTVVTWNLVAQDWLAHSAERIAARVGPLLQPGCVVLFHDALYTMGDEAFADRTPALDAVDLLLAEFSGRYRFVTVPALLAMGRAQVRGWYKRTDRGYLNARIVAAGTARRY